MSVKADWIEWAGGDSPIARGVFHERKYRDGKIIQHRNWNADHFIWKHKGDDHDIIAYRVVKP